jgi:hypothetical protein
LLGQYFLMSPLNEPDIDWTGLQPDRSRIAPLDAHSFVLRLQRLGERASSVTILRNAMRGDHPPDGQQLPRDPESASRPSR